MSSSHDNKNRIPALRPPLLRPPPEVGDPRDLRGDGPVDAPAGAAPGISDHERRRRGQRQRWRELKQAVAATNARAQNGAPHNNGAPRREFETVYGQQGENILGFC